MKLWEVTNGYTGNGYVRCLVIAETEEGALDLARVKFKAEATERYRVRYPNSYYDNLKTEVLCHDTTTSWTGEVNDD